MPALSAALALVALLAAAAAGFTLSFRHRFGPVLTAIRRLNRRVLNPRQLRQAGQPGTWASVVQHVGRRTGTPYRTPVVAVPTAEGFAIVLPYGPGTDWARNVVAAGSATLQHDGRTVAVDQPTVVPIAEVDHLFERSERRQHRAFGLREALLLRRSDEVAATAAAGTALAQPAGAATEGSIAHPAEVRS